MERKLKLSLSDQYRQKEFWFSPGVKTNRGVQRGETPLGIAQRNMIAS